MLIIKLTRQCATTKKVLSELSNPTLIMQRNLHSFVMIIIFSPLPFVCLIRDLLANELRPASATNRFYIRLVVSRILLTNA